MWFPPVALVLFLLDRGALRVSAKVMCGPGCGSVLEAMLSVSKEGGREEEL
jgi:hypothetical protein